MDEETDEKKAMKGQWGMRSGCVNIHLKGNTQGGLCFLSVCYLWLPV